MVGTIVTAGGAGVRFGGEKIFAPVLGEPLLYHTLARLSEAPEIGEITLVLPAARIDAVRDVHGEALSRFGVARYVAGGVTRQKSVANGVATLPAEVDMIVVHDAVRPLVRPSLVSAVIRAARANGCAIAATPVHDTLKRADAELFIVETVRREGIWRAETPQVVGRDLFEAALRLADAVGFVGTDEASLVEHAGREVVLVRSDATNIKVTEPEDLAVVEALLALSREGAKR